MTTPEAHSPPSRTRHDIAVSLSVAVQLFAVAHASPWVPRVAAAAVALCVALASAVDSRARSLLGAMAVRLAIYTLAFASVLSALEALSSRGAIGAVAPLARADGAFLACAIALWCLHGPLIVARWWARARPGAESDRDLIESVGASLLGTVAALSWLNPAHAWSSIRGTAWSTGACVAVGVGAIATAWIARALSYFQARHATSTRAADAVYRGATTAAVAPRVDTRGAWWTRRLLHAVALLWAFGWTASSAARLLHVVRELPPPGVDPASDVMRHIASLRVSPTPCALRDRAAPTLRRRLFEFAPTDAPDTLDRAEVSESGAVVLSHTHRGRQARNWMATRCVSPALALTWIDDPRPAAMMARQAIYTLRRAPREGAALEVAPARCASGRWCSFGWSEPSWVDEDGRESSYRFGVELDAGGRFTCLNAENENTAGVVDARTSAMLLESLRQLAGLSPPSARSAHARAEVVVGAGPLRVAVDFHGVEGLREALRARLCIDPRR